MQLSLFHFNHTYFYYSVTDPGGGDRDLRVRVREEVHRDRRQDPGRQVHKDLPGNFTYKRNVVFFFIKTGYLGQIAILRGGGGKLISPPFL